MIVVKSKERGARTKVNACAYSQDGSLIGGGTPNVIYFTRLCVNSAPDSLYGWRTSHVADQVKLRTTEYDDRGSPCEGI